MSSMCTALWHNHTEPIISAKFQRYFQHIHQRNFSELSAKSATFLRTHLGVLCHDAAMYNVQHVQFWPLAHAPSHCFPSPILPCLDFALHIRKQTRCGCLQKRPNKRLQSGAEHEEDAEFYTPTTYALLKVTMLTDVATQNNSSSAVRFLHCFPDSPCVVSCREDAIELQKVLYWRDNYVKGACIL